MYTTHCEEPNCKKCRDSRRTAEAIHEVKSMAVSRQTPVVLSPEEENQEKILKTVSQSLAKDLLATEDEKEFHLESFEKVKNEIHHHIGRLMEVLRKREQDLCHEVERACREEIEKIHLLTTVQCFDKLRGKDVLDRTPFRSKMVFKSEFDYILSKLENFGQLTFEAKRYTGGSNLKLLGEDVAPTLLLYTPFESETTSENDRYENLAKKLENNVQYLESLVPSTKFGLKRFDELKILSELQQCARKTEKRKILTNVQDDTEQQFEEIPVSDLVHFKEDEEDNSMSLPSTTVTKYTAQQDEQLEKLNKNVKDEEQQFEETSGAFSNGDAGNDSSKLEKGRESLRRLRKSLLQMKINSVNGFKNGSDVLMNEKWENFCKSIIRDKRELEKIKIPAFRAEFGKDDSSEDDDDLEIISRSEAATIPSELPALPPKNRFRFGRKRSWCPSLHSKKLVVPKETKSKIEQPIQQITPSEMIDAFLSNKHEMHDVENVQESSSRWLFNPKSCEKKDIPPFNEQESCSPCLGSSNTESEGHDPSGALVSSFQKYLEKNSEEEWLVTDKSSEQSPSPRNSCIFNREMPILVENLDQWLSAKQKQNLVSDWLYTAPI